MKKMNSTNVNALKPSPNPIEPPTVPVNGTYTDKEYMYPVIFILLHFVYQQKRGKESSKCRKKSKFCWDHNVFKVRVNYNMDL